MDKISYLSGLASKFAKDYLGLKDLTFAAILAFVNDKIDNLGLTIFLIWISILSIWWWFKKVYTNRDLVLACIPPNNPTTTQRLSPGDKLLLALIPTLFVSVSIFSFVTRKTEWDLFRKEFSESKLVIDHLSTVREFNKAYQHSDRTYQEASERFNIWQKWMHNGAFLESKNILFLAIKSKPFTKSYRSFDVKVRSSDVIAARDGVAFLLRDDWGANSHLPRYRQIPITNINVSRNSIDQFLISLIRPDPGEELLLFLRFDVKDMETVSASNLDFSLRVSP